MAEGTEWPCTAENLSREPVMFQDTKCSEELSLLKLGMWESELWIWFWLPQEWSQPGSNLGEWGEVRRVGNFNRRLELEQDVEQSLKSGRVVFSRCRGVGICRIWSWTLCDLRSFTDNPSGLCTPQWIHFTFRCRCAVNDRYCLSDLGMQKGWAELTWPMHLPNQDAGGVCMVP